jgi:hypothetical protein
MSTEVTPDLLRDVAAAWEGSTASDDSIRISLRVRADRLERESKPLPTVPGWYPTIVVERGGESCTGAFRDTSGDWHTPDFAVNEASPGTTIRWAEQASKTPGQTLWEADPTWSIIPRDEAERMANAVLAAHGTPTLTPVGEHPKPGTRGLLPVMVGGDWWWHDDRGVSLVVGAAYNILADPRPDGAL